MTLYGDVKVDETYAGANKLGSLTLVLYAKGRATIFGRTTVAVNGRYRFNNLPSGEYELVVEAEMNEIARVTVSIAGRPGSDHQQDLELVWKPHGANVSSRPATISVDEFYQRSAANQALFVKAQTALDAKKLADAVSHLKQIVGSDPGDFQAWTELGTAFLLSDKRDEAENAYRQALKARPNFKLALLNLGRLLIEAKKYNDAIVPLTTLIEIDRESPDGNLALGQAYIQIKKGSKAVPHLNEAARLGRPDAHLWLATLYNAAGMKDKAVTEYEEFLKKRPDYKDRKALEQYISQNKKQ
jgi:tetratricopeptide (TPR) repeat protein